MRTSLDLDLHPKLALLRSHLAALHRYDITEAAMVILDNDTVRSGDDRFLHTREIRLTEQCARAAAFDPEPFVYLARSIAAF